MLPRAWATIDASAMRQSWLFPFSMDYAVTQMCGVAAFEPADELQFDVTKSGRLEQPPSLTQQHGDEVQFQFVELACCQQRLCRTRAVDQHGSISRCFSGLGGTRVDVGVELRAAGWLVGRVDGVGEHVDRHAVVVVAVPSLGQLERAASGYHGAGRAGLGV